MIKFVIVWAAALLLTADAVYSTTQTNFTAGTVLMWGLCLALVVYGFFHTPIDLFVEQRVGRIVKFIVSAGCIVFAALFIFVAVSGHQNTARGTEKIIIIPGAGLRGEEASSLLEFRLRAALSFWRQNPEALLVVSGGQGAQESISEGIAMQRWLLAHGVSQNNILLEGKSTSTEENFLFSRQVLLEAGIDIDQPTVIITNSFHAYRSQQYARRAGFTQISFYPAKIDVFSALPTYLREVLAIIDLWVFK